MRKGGVSRPLSGDEQLPPGQRIDQWLWMARFIGSRTQASDFIETGRCRINGTRVTRASRAVRPGDVLTFPQGSHIRVIRILALAARRGPAPEARTLYEDLDQAGAAGTEAGDDAGAGALTRCEGPE
ncbi:MAG: RNA-binding S4 domain-containing protein [Parvibaculaceae bacterium]|nr:RNA-binding S4 domain-containing protein [Parvibaculaceae bacterium]